MFIVGINGRKIKLSLKGCYVYSSYPCGYFKLNMLTLMDVKCVEVVSLQCKQFPLTFELFEENRGHSLGMMLLSKFTHQTVEIETGIKRNITGYVSTSWCRKMFLEASD